MSQNFLDLGEDDSLNPNNTVPIPDRSQLNVDYDAQSSGGAKVGRTEEIHRGARIGRTVTDGQGVRIEHPNNVPRGGVGSQRVAQPRPSNSNPQPRQPQRRQTGGTPPSGNTPPNQGNGDNNNAKSNKKVLVAGIFVVLLLIGVVLKFTVLGGKKAELVKEDYNKSGRYALDMLQSALNNYDATVIDNCVGNEDGDSYIGQEWAFVNMVKIREEFIQSVGKLVKFEYPESQQYMSDGTKAVDNSGKALYGKSMMNNGESCKVTVPDYDKLAQTMTEEKEAIIVLFKSSKYSKNDYTWNDEMANLMLQYILDRGDIPTKTVEMKFNIKLNSKGKPYIVSDADLDDVLFGSDAFHEMCARFSQICLGWTGKKTQHYIDKVYKHNPEYDRWLDLFLKYYKQDGGKFNAKTGKFHGGHFHKGVSKWEPWFLRDDDNNFIRDKKGNKIVNYYSVKKSDGTDWIQPAEKIKINVKKTRQIADPWKEETAIQYNWIGTNWIQNKYSGVGDTTIRVGDGSKEHPAGIGTSIITKVLCKDGKYHDVRVSVLGYWTEQNAIDYAEKFSTKNRGFTTSSVIQLICYEVKVENLENRPIKFMSSEMALCDGNGNISARTGTMYAFTKTVSLGKKESIILNDWATSTELAQKYVVWGKSFNTVNKEHSLVYFDILAGTGNIPSYSAYEQFSGQSSIDESVNTGQEKRQVNATASPQPSSETTK